MIFDMGVFEKELAEVPTPGVEVLEGGELFELFVRAGETGTIPSLHACLSRLHGRRGTLQDMVILLLVANHWSAATYAPLARELQEVFRREEWRTRLEPFLHLLPPQLRADQVTWLGLKSGWLVKAVVTEGLYDHRVGVFI